MRSPYPLNPFEEVPTFYGEILHQLEMLEDLMEEYKSVNDSPLVDRAGAMVSNALFLWKDIDRPTSVKDGNKSYQ